MFVWLLHLLGVAPAGGKTGKREAAWALIAIALGLTIAGLILGPETLRAMDSVLVVLWPSAILAVAGAYKLEFDKTMMARRRRPPDEASPLYDDNPGPRP